MCSAASMKALGAADECVYEAVGDISEHRADQLLEQLARELVGQSQLNLASGIAERREAPDALQVSKRPLNEANLDRARGMMDVFRREVGVHAVIVDVQRSARHSRFTEFDTSC